MLPSAHAERASHLRDRIDRRRTWIRDVLSEGGSSPPASSGLAACAALSDEYDELVSELWRAAQPRLGESAWREMCLVATGGWGRREVCPYSDIDFVLLAPPRLAAAARAAADELLYPLWDAGIKVGHAVRNVAATADLARGDLATATALLDARRVVGDPALFDELARATRRALAPGGNPNQFVAMLAAEKEKRHDRFGDSLYLLEPNLKQGIGALRDLATAIWAARARWSVSSLGELVAQGNLSARQAAILGEALDFLLRLRSLVQLHAGRATDQLTFEIQEAVAPRLYPDASLPAGDIRPAVAPAVEALMRRYYLHARAVVRVADRLLESARVPERRKPRIRSVDSSFLLWNGKLAAADPAVFREHPAEMVRLFRVALALEVPIYRHTIDLVEENLAVGASALTGDPVASRHFLEALVDLRDDRQPSLLEEMHQAGVLNALMPEFAPCTCRVQHDLYHVYTVDQHQLYAVAMLKRTMRGELADEAPLASEVARAIGPSVPLFLGTLLHDCGKPLGKGHAEKGAALAGSIARRLGLGERDAERTETLVRQHLAMAHLSQRRDLTDPAVIQRFGERIGPGDERALGELYLLTRCDTAMTSPGNLSAWKDQLLGELYTRTRDLFRGAAADAGAASAAAPVRQRVRELLPAGEPALRELAERLDDRTVLALTPRQIARHLVLASRRRQAGAAVDIDVAAYPLKGLTEVAVVADDKLGLLSHIAGVLAAHRVSIDAAVVSTVDGLALDLFYVRDPYGRVIAADDTRWDLIRRDLTAVLTASGESSTAVIDLLAKRRRRSTLKRFTPAVPTTVHVVDDASQDFTVVEVASRDEVGLLHTITRTMTDLGLDIHLAKVATEGEKAADAFYVTDRAEGGKLRDPARVAELEAALLSALAAQEAP
jgi:[protein-PII] uridylyltransferase